MLSREVFDKIRGFDMQFDPEYTAVDMAMATAASDYSVGFHHKQCRPACGEAHPLRIAQPGLMRPQSRASMNFMSFSINLCGGALSRRMRGWCVPLSHGKGL